MSSASMRQAKLASLGAVVTPLVALVLIRFAGPSQTVAATSPPVIDTPSLPTPGVPIREESGVIASAAQYAQRLFEAGFSGAPFPVARPEPSASDTPPDPRAAVSSEANTAEEAPELQLSAIMARRNGAIAVIDGRIRTSGSEVAPGWVLETIDEPGRRIVIRSRAGRRLEIPLSVP